MFLLQEGFCKRMTQMFGNPKKELITKDKLEIIQQTSLTMAYLTEFQMWVIQTSWNQEVLIAKYC